MAKLEIGGKQVEVDDSFLKLSPEQQNATVDEIAKSLGAQPEKSSTMGDILKSAGSGVAQGAMDLVGLPGTIQNAFDNSISAITGVKAPPPSQLSGEELRRRAGEFTDGATEYKPETTAGEYAQTVGQFVPGAVALGGSGSVASNALKFGVVPGVTSETSGKLAEKYAPSLEPYARFAGGILGSMAAPAARIMVPSSKDAALSEIGKAAAADNMTPQQMRARLQELGPEAMIADLGPNFQGQTGAIANLPGRGNEIIRSALDERNAGANARLDASLDQLGPRVIPSKIDETLQAGQRTIGPQYDDVMQTATRVDTQPLADRLDALVVNTRGPEQQAVRNVRGYLNIPGTNTLDPNPQALHATREAIDGLLRTEQNPNVIRQLTTARQEVDDVLAQSAPGIKDVDAQYHELARQREALTEGTRALDSGRTAPRPEELADRLAEGAIPHGNMVGPSATPLRLSQGARADIDRIVGTNRNDIVAMNNLIKGEGDWNRAKLVSLFGEERANQLLRVLENEKAYADTRNFATGNSLSANRLQYQKAYGGSGDRMSIPEYYGAGGILGAIRGAGVKGAEKLASVLMGGRSEARNAELAKNLTGREAVVDALLRQPSTRTRLTGPAKQALIQALLDQQRRLEAQ